MSSTNKSLEEVNTDSWLTAVEVVDLCGISLQTVSNYKRAEKLKPLMAMRTLRNGTRREVEVFDPHEVARLPNNRRQSIVTPGEQAARAFEMFDEGLALRDVVVSLRMEPGRVTELYDEWADLGGSEFVIGKAAREELGRLLGPFEGVADLVRRISERLGVGGGSPAGGVQASR